ncbi:hypothetical protein FHL15_011260 [Xylaria flabelliformis]|uniref:Secreted protein n=1 Tax=Xylaria flabelliformis TaxID=2512241 RepID=A0A553HIR8_9PEZI|nr:hypothetical protein FHL15_011260 [Xylaria flabelliformis]
MLFSIRIFLLPAAVFILPLNQEVCTREPLQIPSATRKIASHVPCGGMRAIINIDIRKWCRAGFLTCVTANPKLFHHHKNAGTMTSEAAAVEGKGWEDVRRPS